MNIDNRFQQGPRICSRICIEGLKKLPFLNFQNSKTPNFPQSMEVICMVEGRIAIGTQSR